MEIKTFADFDLPVKVLDVLADDNLFEPTPIQKKSFSHILSGRDVMGIAQTGTGKTLAYLLPVLKQWKYNKTGNPTDRAWRSQIRVLRRSRFCRGGYAGKRGRSRRMDSRPWLPKPDSSHGELSHPAKPCRIPD